MKTKNDITKNWLPRYTGTKLDEFGDYILLTNFYNYIELFAERFQVEIKGKDSVMQTATSNNITIIDFGMGSAMAATVMDLVSAIKPKAALFQMWRIEKKDQSRRFHSADRRYSR